MKTFLTVLPPEASIDTLDLIAQFSVESNARLFVVIPAVAIAVPSTVFPSVPSYGGEQEFAILTKQLLCRPGYHAGKKQVLRRTVPPNS